MYIVFWKRITRGKVKSIFCIVYNQTNCTYCFISVIRLCTPVPNVLCVWIKAIWSVYFCTVWCFLKCDMIKHLMLICVLTSGTPHIYFWNLFLAFACGHSDMGVRSEWLFVKTFLWCDLSHLWGSNSVISVLAMFVSHSKSKSAPLERRKKPVLKLF